MRLRVSISSSVKSFRASVTLADSATRLETNIYELAKELTDDIRSNLDAWAKWPGDISEDEISERKADFEVLCEMIEKRNK